MTNTETTMDLATKTEASATALHELDDLITEVCRELKRLTSGMACPLKGIRPFTIQPASDWSPLQIQLTEGDRQLMPRLMFRKVTTNYKRGEQRLEIGGPWPVGPLGVHGPADKAHGKPITVALGTDPATIAADVLRRFLPRYLAAHVECQRDIAELVDSANADRAMAERLYEGSEAAQGGGGRIAGPRQAPSFAVDAGSAWGSVTVANGKASIELRSLTEAQAAAVLKALGEAS